ncbi:hypothetical protein F4818DRAFT_445152 [Hypoxylon cercidicola]|nr:hypothetical protein F4818DRAFT_445152 [Hypoxylon cercidicola]
MDAAFVTSCIMCFLCLLAVGFRFYSRKLTKAGLRWDDGLIFAAAILVVVLLALSILAKNIRVKVNGCHKRDLVLNEKTVLSLLLLFNALYLFSVCFTKLSALCLYIRIFTQRKFLLTCKILGVVIAILYIAVLVQEFTVSGIAVQLWNRPPLGTLTDKKKVDIGTAFFSILGNVVVLVLPLPLIWKLQMSITKKINLTVLFLSGLCVTAIASFRLIAIVRADYNNEIVAVTGRIMSLQVLEPELAVFTLCLPVLHRFWLKLWERCFGVRRRRQQVYRMNSINSHVKREGEQHHIQSNEFTRPDYSRYSVSVGVGTPAATRSNRGGSKSCGQMLARGLGRNPGRNANMTQLAPINVDRTWSVAYEAASAPHQNAPVGTHN